MSRKSDEFTLKGLCLDVSYLCLDGPAAADRGQDHPRPRQERGRHDQL